MPVQSSVSSMPILLEVSSAEIKHNKPLKADDACFFQTHLTLTVKIKTRNWSLSKPVKHVVELTQAIDNVQPSHQLLPTQNRKHEVALLNIYSTWQPGICIQH